MNDGKNFISIEKKAIAIFRQAEQNPSASLDERIKAIARNALKEREEIPKNYLLRSNFTLMAASDSYSSGAAVIVDEENGIKLTVWVARGNNNAYRIKIEGIDENKDIFNRYVGHKYSILVNGKSIYDDFIAGNHVSKNVKISDDENKNPQWGFSIHPK